MIDPKDKIALQNVQFKVRLKLLENTYERLENELLEIETLNKVTAEQVLIDNDDFFIQAKRETEFYMKEIERIRQSEELKQDSDLDSRISEIKQKIQDRSKRSTNFFVFLLYVLTFLTGILFMKNLKKPLT